MPTNKTSKSDTDENELIKRWKDRVENCESVSEIAYRCAEKTTEESNSKDIYFTTPITVAFPYVRAQLKFELKDDEVLDDFTMFFLKCLNDGISTADLSEITQFPENVITDEYEALSEQGFAESDENYCLTELGKRQLLVYELINKLHKKSIECSIDLWDGNLSFGDRGELTDGENIGSGISRVDSKKDFFYIKNMNYANEAQELIAKMISESEPSFTYEETILFLDSITVTADFSKDDLCYKLKELSAVPRKSEESEGVPVVISSEIKEYELCNRRFEEKKRCIEALELINNQMPEMLTPEAGAFLAEYHHFQSLSGKGLFTETCICGEDHDGLELLKEKSLKPWEPVVTIPAVVEDEKEQLQRKLSHLTDDPDIYAVMKSRTEAAYIAYVPYSYFKYMG